MNEGSAAAGLLAGLPGFPGLLGVASPGGGHAHLPPYHPLHQAAALPAAPTSSAKKASVAGSSTPSPSNSNASASIIDFSGTKRRNDARDAKDDASAAHNWVFIFFCLE